MDGSYTKLIAHLKNDAHSKIDVPLHFVALSNNHFGALFYSERKGELEKKGEKICFNF